ncbi:MAG: amidohydrolase [Tissierellia bacterium]|nr:amidohydrolase [Tissierellia bacterium]
MKEQIKAYIEAILPDLISLRREIHKNPELSNKELETSRLIKEKLMENGIEASTISSGLGVTALIEGAKKGKTVATIYIPQSYMVQPW